MLEELKQILRTTVGKIIATILAAAAAALGAVQTGVLDINPDDLNPVSAEEQPVDE